MTGQELQSLADRLGVRQRDIVAYTGTSRQRISYIFHDVKPLTKKTEQKYLNAIIEISEIKDAVKE